MITGRFVQPDHFQYFDHSLKTPLVILQFLYTPYTTPLFFNKLDHFFMIPAFNNIFKLGILKLRSALSLFSAFPDFNWCRHMP